jgi:hypothetical protein
VEINQTKDSITLNQSRQIEETYNQIKNETSNKEWSTPIENKIYKTLVDDNQGKTTNQELY